MFGANTDIRDLKGLNINISDNFCKFHAIIHKNYIKYLYLGYVMKAECFTK